MALLPSQYWQLVASKYAPAAGVRKRHPSTFVRMQSCSLQVLTRTKLRAAVLSGGTPSAEGRQEPQVLPNVCCETLPTTGGAAPRLLHIHTVSFKRRQATATRMLIANSSLLACSRFRDWHRRIVPRPAQNDQVLAHAVSPCGLRRLQHWHLRGRAPLDRGDVPAHKSMPWDSGF